MTVQDIQNALLGIHPNQVKVIKNLAGVYSLDPEKLTTAQYKKLIEVELVFEEYRFDSDRSHARKLEAISKLIDHEM